MGRQRRCVTRNWSFGISRCGRGIAGEQADRFNNGLGGQICSKSVGEKQADRLCLLVEVGAQWSVSEPDGAGAPEAPADVPLRSLP
jgi:hypothetical protein